MHDRKVSSAWSRILLCWCYWRLLEVSEWYLETNLVPPSCNALTSEVTWRLNVWHRTSLASKWMITTIILESFIYWNNFSIVACHWINTRSDQTHPGYFNFEILIATYIMKQALVVVKLKKSEFKSSSLLFVFHLTLIPLGKVYI